MKCESAAARRYTRRVRADACALLGLMKMERAELSVVLTDDQSIRKLNRDFRGKDQATDVLSFPQFDDLRSGMCSNGIAAPLTLGDIVISVETAAQQAKIQGAHTADRIRTLLIHGLLHLIGYDHERSRTEARRMFTRERELAAGLRDGGRGTGRPMISPGAHEVDWPPGAMPPTPRRGIRRKASVAIRSRSAD